VFTITFLLFCLVLCCSWPLNYSYFCDSGCSPRWIVFPPQFALFHCFTGFNQLVPWVKSRDVAVQIQLGPWVAIPKAQ
jgi:hypothetical protein